MIRKIYLIEHLDCAHCAANVERKLSQLPEVEEVTLTFATKQLRITAEDPDALLPKLQKAAETVEPGVQISPYQRQRSSSVTKTQKHEHSHEHHHSHHHEEESCSCGHDHSHEHHHDGHDHQKAHSAQDFQAIDAPKKLSENQKALLILFLGAALLAGALVFSHMEMTLPSILLYAASYLVLGGKIVLTAIKNLFRGHIFDENFLMAVATLGAFAIQEFPEAVGVMFFFQIGELFEHIAVEKSRSQIMAAVDLRPEVVQLVVGEDTQTIPAEDAQVGDVLLVRAGDRIPLDGIVLDGVSRLDTSAITGEPVPVAVHPGDAVLSGCVNESGILKIQVDKILTESMVTRILNSVENAAASKPKIDRFITRFARVYTPIVVFLALGTAIVPSLFTGNWNYWIYTALSFLVMSCPCALVLSVPLAFFCGIGTGSKRSILFKGGLSLEAMTRISTVVMDKTGTITEGNFIVQSLSPVTGTDEDLLALGAGCELSSTHPIGVSIVRAAKERGLTIPTPQSVEEIAGHGIKALLPDGEILCGNEKLMEQNHISLAEHVKSSFGTEVLLAKNGSYLGSIVISDTIKKDAKSAIAALKKLNIVTAMLTGDGAASAKAVAAQTGIDEVHAKLLPQDKLTKLQEIRSRHGAVMFVGDGINDAPVLAGADVGAAMGSGADAAIEAADVVFMTSNMDAVPQSLSIARSTSRIAWQNVVFALAIKIGVMILGLTGHASMWLAVFADTGVAMLCILNSVRILYQRLERTPAGNP